MAWKVDPTQSKIEFSVRHLQVTTVRGHFASFEGTLVIDEETPSASTVEGTVDVASVHTPLSPRDRNLRSKAFFDAARLPKMSFRSTRLEAFQGDTFKLHGEMTIRDITREVAFDVVNKGEMLATAGKRRWAFGASIVLNRKDFGLQWHPLIEVGGLAVDDMVQGIIEIQAVQE
jgi:polyisoprenoid-binding protein YceI